jgi:hypothetical protein
MFRTYEEWRAHNYQVLRGQKARKFRKDGKALFSHTKVSGLEEHNHGDGGWENIHNQSDLWDHPDFYDGWDNIGDKD